MKKAAWYLVFAMVILFMTVAVFTYLAPHLGWQANAVSSGSMEPQLKVGSLMVIRPVEPETIVVGDIITFRPSTVGENMITHRVIGMGHSSSLHFQTKGDANGYPDPLTVPAQNLIGKICFHVPYVGYITEFLKTPFGFVLGLVVPTLIITTVYVRSVWQVLNKDKKQNPNEIASR